MAKKKIITRKQLKEDAEKFVEKQQMDKTILTLDWMDSYVAKLFPEKAEEYADKCSVLPMKTDSEDGKSRKDIVGIRKIFTEMFFNDLTDEKVKARKKAEKEKKKKEEDNRTPKERILDRLKELAEEEDE